MWFVSLMIRTSTVINWWLVWLPRASYSTAAIDCNGVQKLRISTRQLRHCSMICLFAGMWLCLWFMWQQQVYICTLCFARMQQHNISTIALIFLLVVVLYILFYFCKLSAQVWYWLNSTKANIVNCSGHAFSVRIMFILKHCL